MENRRGIDEPPMARSVVGSQFSRRTSTLSEWIALVRKTFSRSAWMPSRVGIVVTVGRLTQGATAAEVTQGRLEKTETQKAGLAPRVQAWTHRRCWRMGLVQAVVKRRMTRCSVGCRYVHPAGQAHRQQCMCKSCLGCGDTRRPERVGSACSWESILTTGKEAPDEGRCL